MHSASHSWRDHQVLCVLSSLSDRVGQTATLCRTGLSACLWGWEALWHHVLGHHPSLLRGWPLSLYLVNCTTYWIDLHNAPETTGELLSLVVCFFNLKTLHSRIKTFPRTPTVWKDNCSHLSIRLEFLSFSRALHCLLWLLVETFVFLRYVQLYIPGDSFGATPILW